MLHATSAFIFARDCDQLLFYRPRARAQSMLTRGRSCSSARRADTMSVCHSRYDRDPQRWFLTPDFRGISTAGAHRELTAASSAPTAYERHMKAVANAAKARFHQIAGPVGTRSFDCRMPNAATLAAVCDGTSNHLVRSVA
jgi:hypothetical protein